MADKPFNLGETCEWTGLWWLPSARENRLPGVLRYDTDGNLSLSLIGAFEDRIFSTPSPGVTVFHGGTQNWEVIHGVADQREVTLLNCYPTSSKRTLGAKIQTPDKQTIRALTALIGVHVSSENETKFSATEVSIENLHQWSSSFIFSGFMGATDGNLDGSGHISVTPVPAQSVIVDRIKYTLDHRHTLPFFDQKQGGTIARMSDTTYLRMDHAESYSLKEAKDFARSMQDLIAIATHRTAGIIWLRLIRTDKDSDLSPTRSIRDRSVEVIYTPSKIGQHEAPAINSHSVFFTCDDLPFEKVIPRWIETYNRLKVPLNMILGLRYAPAQYVENNLITAVGAAEVFHRSLKIDEQPMPNDDFQSMREELLKLVPPEHYHRIKGSIRNEQTLRERLCALAHRLDRRVMDSLMPDVNRWAQQTTKARNHLTHEGQTSKHTLDELLAIINVTNTVVILNLLNEIGLPADHQLTILQEHPQLQVTVNQAKNILRPTG